MWGGSNFEGTSTKCMGIPIISFGRHCIGRLSRKSCWKFFFPQLAELRKQVWHSNTPCHWHWRVKPSVWIYHSLYRCRYFRYDCRNFCIPQAVSAAKAIPNTNFVISLINSLMSFSLILLFSFLGEPSMGEDGTLENFSLFSIPTAIECT